MTSLRVVAHAPTAALRRAGFNAGDDHLDEGGHAAALVAFSPRNGRHPLGRPDLVLTSAASAPRQTAVAAGLVATDHAALADADAGSWRGRDLADVLASDPSGIQRWMSDPAARPPAGESLVELRDRVGDWLDGIADSDRAIVAFTHPSVVRAAVAVALDLPPAAHTRIDVGPLTVVELRAGRGGWRLNLHAA